MKYKCRICNKIITNKRRTVVCSNICCNKYLSLKAKRWYKKTNYREKHKIRRLRLRFEIFQHDNFTCQYCGRKVPEVMLEIDHKYPASKGGANDRKNYTTACKDCNLGKGDIILNEFKRP